MVRFATRIILLLVLCPVSLFGQESPNHLTGASEQQIDQWIVQLGAAQFDARDRATQALIAAGRAAIPRMLKAVNGRDREVALRSVVAMQEIGARGDSDTLQAALEALESAATQAMSPAVARQATDALASLTVVRQERAIEHLRKLGAVITNGTDDHWYQSASRGPLPGPVFAIEFGAQWQGTEADLERLVWITDVEQVNFVGPEVKESWFRYLRKLPRLHYIKVKRAPITNQGLAELSQIEGLWFLRLMFVSLDDSAVPLLENAKGIRKLVVISRQLSEKGAEQLQQHFGKDNVDCPKGALLGVTANQADGDNWRVTSVLEGSAAAKAGILEGDRIAKYNGRDITDFRSLRALISQSEPGETVTMEIERGLEKLTKQVVFGEWD